MVRLIGRVNSSPLLTNIYQSFLALLFFYLFYALNFSWFLGLLFLALLIKFYFSSYEERKNFRFSYWFLNLFAVFLIYHLGDKFLPFLLILYFVSMFFILSFANLVFGDKKKVYYVFNALEYFLAFSIFLGFENFMKSKGVGYFALWAFIFFFVVYFLTKEWWKNVGYELKQREKFWSFVIAFISVEFFLIFSAISLNFWVGAFTLSILVFVLRNIYSAYEKGELNTNLVFKEILSFVLMFLIILFLASRFGGI